MSSRQVADDVNVICWRDKYWFIFYHWNKLKQNGHDRYHANWFTHFEPLSLSDK